MQHLMKRLEIIKAAISLEDEETIRLHMEKIRGASEEAEELKLILTQLEALDYSNALNRITTFLARTAAVSLYADPEVAALKMELQGLERRVANLSSERDEALHRLEEFNRLYSLRLGGVISDILKLEMLIAGAAESRHQHDSEEIRARFAQQRKRAQHDYQRFHGQYKGWLSAPQPRELSAEEDNRLKTAYRRASRLCHPDMVAEEFKDQATEQFQALHQAYRLNDLTRVEGMLATLAGGESFAPVSEQVEDKNQLRAQIRVLREQVQTLTAEIKQIRSDDTWRLVVILDGDYATFFTEQETALQAKLVRLQQEFMELV